MKEIFRTSLLFTFLMTVTLGGKSQVSMPDELTQAQVKEQVNYIEAHTKIYENYRAIREDMFQKLKKNINDTLSLWNNQIGVLKAGNTGLKSTIDSLNNSLTTTKANLDEITKSKNSIRFFGAEVEKDTYNTIMWTIIIILVLVLLIGFMVFKRNQNVIVNRNKDLQDLKTEFEAYRKTSREAREKMALTHFNELKKLRGE
jgi:peptidoglycan hydrolase CwlO-like protein